MTNLYGPNTKRGEHNVENAPYREDHRHTDDAPEDKLSTFFALPFFSTMNQEVAHDTPNEDKESEGKDERHNDRV